jgi:luciferase family oxidoreductase group 1
VKLGLLDISQLAPDQRPTQSLAISREVVARADAAGFARYWLAEHHTLDVAHSSPDLLVALFADITEQIRIGVAGVLLHYRSPLSVAEGFGLLDAMYPGRIDLGLARGRSPQPVAEALLDGRPAALDRTSFERRVEEVLAYLRDEAPTRSTPVAVAAPEVWLLGHGPESAACAGRLGLCSSQALFLPGGEPDPAVADTYRQRFAASAAFGPPRSSVAIAGFIASTNEEARGRAARHANDRIRPGFWGDVGAWSRYLAGLRTRYKADEVIFLDLSTKASDRLRSVDLLSDAAALEPAALEPTL